MYSEQLMEEFLNPKNYGVIKGASSVGKTVSDVAGEIIKIFMKVEDNRIVDCKFQTFGGVVAIALTSFATNMMLGRTILGAKRIMAEDLIEAAGGVPEEKKYLAQMVIDTIDRAMEKYEDKEKEDQVEDTQSGEDEE